MELGLGTACAGPSSGWYGAETRVLNRACLVRCLPIDSLLDVIDYNSLRIRQLGSWLGIRKCTCGRWSLPMIGKTNPSGQDTSYLG